MDFDLDNLNPATRFFVNDENEKDGWVELRVCPADILEDINDKTTIEKAEYRKGQRHVVVKKNQKQWKKLFWDYVISDWGGITNNKREMKCTAANKIKLMGGSIQFSAFVSDRLETLTADMDLHKEEVEKN